MGKLPKARLVTWTAISALVLLCGTAVANASCPQVGFALVEPHASSATRPVKVGKNKTIFVRRVPITTTRDIAQLKLVRDGGDDASLLIKFTPAADQRLHDETTNISGQRIAFIFDDEVLIDTVWEGPYGMYRGGTQVSMRHGLARARKLIKAIQGCTGGRIHR